MSEQVHDETPAETAVLKSIPALESAIATYMRDVPLPTETAAGIVLFNVVDALKSAGCPYWEIVVELERVTALVAAYIVMEDKDGQGDGGSAV